MSSLCPRVTMIEIARGVWMNLFKGVLVACEDFLRHGKSFGIGECLAVVYTAIPKPAALAALATAIETCPAPNK